jgi:N6-adenosine-specific RNA methylase IME4
MRLFNWPFGELEAQAYNFIMADPPWRFELRSEKGEEKSAQSHYETMSLEEINELPVMDLARKDTLLWLWGTAPMLNQQLTTVRAWGFRFITEGVWVKMTTHGKVHFGTGYALRGSHEPFILAKRGNPKLTKSTRSVIFGKVREHSRKPEEAYEAAEKLMPGATRADLFSRTNRPGWTAWGKQTGKFNVEEAA